MPYEYVSDQTVVPAKQARKIRVQHIVLRTTSEPKVIDVRYDTLDQNDNVVAEGLNVRFTFGVGGDVEPTDVLITRAAQANVTALDVYTALQSFVYGSLALTRAGFPTSGSVT